MSSELNNENEDQASAIRWLIENRVPGITRPDAIRRMRRALRSDRRAQATLDELERQSPAAT